MKIGLDIDGVLCNFVQGVIDKAIRLGIGDLFPQDWRDVKHWYLTKDGSSDWWTQVDSGIRHNIPFWLSLQPLPYSLPLDFPVDRYVTARTIPSHITRAWLDLHGFPKADVHTVDPKSLKDKIEHTRDLDLFVDDHWENVRYLRSEGVNAVLFEAPYQRGHDCSGLPKIRSLSEINGLIKQTA